MRASLVNEPDLCRRKGLACPDYIGKLGYLLVVRGDFLVCLPVCSGSVVAVGLCGAAGLGAATCRDPQAADCRNGACACASSRLRSGACASSGASAGAFCAWLAAVCTCIGAACACAAAACACSTAACACAAAASTSGGTEACCCWPQAIDSESIAATVKATARH